MAVCALVVLAGMAVRASAAEEGDAAKPPPPRVAFFPLGGDADEDVREKVGFSLRSKLDRAGGYEVIDGPRMQEIVAEADGGAITLATDEAKIKDLARLAEAQLLVWGEVSGKPGDRVVRLRLLDLREPGGKVREVSKAFKEPTDLRFLAESVLETLPAVAKFQHPSEEAVQRDERAEALWKTGPNLVTNGDFSQPGKWHAIYQSEKYEVEVSDVPPATDKVNILRLPAGKGPGGKATNVLAMKLSRTCAENNGMACLSAPIEISRNQRYRLAFKYASDGPVLHVFVKGYTIVKGADGKPEEREIYRRQVPVTGATGGKWVEVVDELNPQHVTFPVQLLRVDLYAYLSPGTVMFDDVVLKHVGAPTRKAQDKAIDRPVTRPANAGPPSR